MRRLLLAAALVAAAALLPSTASAAQFTYGVASAEVTPTSALLWARAPKAGKLQVEVAQNPRFTRKRVSKTLVAKKSDDLTVQIRVAKLAPAHRYFFFFHQGRKRSVLGTFVTAPPPSSAA